MKILSQLCSIPTAPFAEQRVIRYIEQFAADRPRLRLRRDRFDNLLLELPGRKPGPRLVLVAHMDHPGFVARRMIDGHTLHADFYGGVLADYVKGSKVRFFDGDRQIVGRVISTTADKQRPTYPAGAKVRVDGNVAAGSPGMFDQGAGRARGRRFYSRVCDDLAGAASALTALDMLIHRRPTHGVAVLLTRAEEDAFIGAMGAVLYPTLLKKTDRVISIECSAMQVYARQGQGVVLRVGDRTSIFNSSFMYFINQQAEAIAAEDDQFKHQRALMPGGTCEATVFDAYGYTTGAVCVPLGNYHNMDRQTKKIGPEHVDLNDWLNMVKLLARIGMNIHRYAADFGGLKKRIEAKFNSRRKLLISTRVVPSPGGRGFG